MIKNKIIKICDYLIEYGILAIIFFIPIIFDFTGTTFNVVDIYKAVAFRVVLTLAILAYTAKIFLSGKLSCRGGKKIFLFTALLALSFFISSLFSIHPEASLWGNFFRQQGFYNQVHHLLFFVLLVLNLNNFKQVRRIILTAVVSASLVSIYGLSQYFNLDPVLWQERAVDLRRIFSSLGQPNWFGHFLILVLPLSVYAWFFLVKSFLARWLIALSILLELSCLLLTYSRAAWLGFLGSAVFLLLAWLISKRYKRTAWGLAILVFIGLTMVVGLNIIKPIDYNRIYVMNPVNRLKSVVDFRGGSNIMRLYYLRAAIKELKQAQPLRLLSGYGPETLTSIFIKYYQVDWGVHEAINGSPDRAHNWFFDQILTLGILGLTATLVFYIYFIYKIAAFFSHRHKLEEDGWLLLFLAASLLAYFINNLFSFSLLTNLVYLFLILAVAWFIINRSQEEKVAVIPLATFSKILIWLAFLAVAALFIYTNNFNQVRAEIYYQRAIKAMQHFNCNGMINNMEKVLALRPNTLYYQDNFIFMSANCLPLISDQIAQIELSETILSQIESIKDKEFSDLQIDTARFYAMLGVYIDKAYYNQAESIFNRLILKHPYLTNAFEDFGRMKMLQGDYAGAIEVFKKAIAILPSFNNPDLNPPHRLKIEIVTVRFYEEIGQAYIKTKNFSLARDYYEKALRLDPYRATLYKGLADIYYLEGRLDQAISLNKRGLTLFPADYHWPLSISLLYRDRKDLTAAKDYLNQAIKLAPENQDLKKYYEELNGKNN